MSDNRTLEELLEAVRKLPPMTDEEKIEQAISFAWGNCAIEWPDPHPFSLDKFAATVWRDKWRTMKAERDSVREELGKLRAMINLRSGFEK